MKKAVRSILNGLGVPIMVVEADMTIAYLNAAAMTLLPDADTGTALKAVIQNKDKRKEVKKVLAYGTPAQIRITLQGVVPTSYRLTVAAIDEDEDKRSVIISFEDVSHIRDAEKMREDFVANVSHELRSPLTALIGFIETLQGPAKNDGAAAERFLSMMQLEAERMARLIGDLLSLSKLQSRERIAPKEDTDVRSVIEQVGKSLAGLCAKEDNKLDIQLEQDTPFVVGVRDELTQVFQNLIENAIKYSAPDSDIIIRGLPVAKNAKFLCVQIVDTGDGIEPKHIPRLTERFYRIDKGRSRLKGGTGLGLAIVKHVLIRHRGWMEITSEMGVGSTFSVFLPIAADA